MKKSNKRYLFVFIVIIVLSIVFFLIYGTKSNKIKMPQTIIIDNDTVFRLNGNRWIKLDKDSKTEELNWEKFNVYTDHDYYGKYYLVNQEKWYLFDENKNAATYEGSFIALDIYHQYKVLNIKFNGVDDFSYIEKYIKENDIPENEEFTSSSVISFDIDNDGNNEKIYTISNRFSEQNNSGVFFGFIIMIKNNRIYPIYSNISKEDDSFDGCMPYVNNIIDVNQDNKFEIIISCSYYSNSGREQRLYEFDNANFNLLVSNYE